MGYLCGSGVAINIVVAARIMNMTEDSFPQIPLMLTALAGFDGTIFGINALHSSYQAHVEAKQAAAQAGKKAPEA